MPPCPGLAPEPGVVGRGRPRGPGVDGTVRPMCPRPAPPPARVSRGRRTAPPTRSRAQAASAPGPQEPPEPRAGSPGRKVPRSRGSGHGSRALSTWPGFPPRLSGSLRSEGGGPDPPGEGRRRCGDFTARVTRSGRANRGLPRGAPAARRLRIGRGLGRDCGPAKLYKQNTEPEQRPP